MRLESYNLHGVAIHFTTTDERIAARLRRQWAPFRGEGIGPPLHMDLQIAAATPPPPLLPAAAQGPTVIYHVQGTLGTQLIAFFPQWGRFDVDLAAATVQGQLTASALPVYGLFEDMILIALAPLLRRRGFFTIHAFAAEMGGRGVLLIGDVGAGKTTSGLSLLAAGTRLIANDTPLLRFTPAGGVEVCAYPGLLSAYPDSLAWFPELAGVLAEGERGQGSAKRSFAVDEISARPLANDDAAGAPALPPGDPRPLGLRVAAPAPLCRPATAGQPIDRGLGQRRHPCPPAQPAPAGGGGTRLRPAPGAGCAAPARPGAGRAHCGGSTEPAGVGASALSGIMRLPQSICRGCIPARVCGRIWWINASAASSG